MDRFFTFLIITLLIITCAYFLLLLNHYVYMR